MKLTFNNYLKYARKTAIYKDGIFYPALGLCCKSGEVADKIKKIYQDNNGIISKENKEQLIKEMGNVLWYLSNMAMDLGVTLEDVAKKNLEKIQTRLVMKLIHGEGNNREESKRYSHKKAIEFSEKIKEAYYQTPEYLESLEQNTKDLVDRIMKMPLKENE